MGNEQYGAGGTMTLSTDAPAAWSAKRWRRSSGNLTRVCMILPSVLLLILVIYIPLVLLLLRSFTEVTEGAGPFSNYRGLLASEPVLRSYLTSFWLALATVVVVTFLGYPLAYWLAGIRPRLAAGLMLIVTVPFWTSLTVSVFAFQLVLGRDGPINRLLIAGRIVDEPAKLLFTSFSVLVGFVYIGLPLLVLPLYAAMRNIDRSLCRAAETLGATPTQAFCSVFLPLSLPGTVAGMTLVFITTVGYFIVPQLLGGKSENMIGQYILWTVRTGNDVPLAAAQTVFLLLVVLVVLAVVDWLFGLKRFLSRGNEVG